MDFGATGVLTWWGSGEKVQRPYAVRFWKEKSLKKNRSTY